MRHIMVEADAKQQKSRSRLSGSKLNWMQFNSHYWVPLLNTVVQMRGCWYRFSMDYVEVSTAILPGVKDNNDKGEPHWSDPKKLDKYFYYAMARACCL
jgi:hypothetical protein